jgi:hypothetical protein
MNVIAETRTDVLRPPSPALLEWGELLLPPPPQRRRLDTALSTMLAALVFQAIVIHVVAAVARVELIRRHGSGPIVPSAAGVWLSTAPGVLAMLTTAHRIGYAGRMAAPTYDAETLAAYFHPIRPETWVDPIVGPVLRRLAAEAPEVIEAVGEVDRSLIEDALARTPDARLARARSMAAFIERTQESMGHGPR